MKWTEHSIARAIALQTLDRKCVVLADNCNWTGYECDLLGVTTDLRIIDIEVKISRSDLKADAKKDKWWHTMTYAEGKAAGLVQNSLQWDPWQHKTPVLHPRKIWKHYYAMPREVWNDSLFEFLPSPASGVLLLSQAEPPQPSVIVQCVRRATPAKDAYRLKPEEVMDIARLANLRMWEAYKRCDACQAEAARWREQLDTAVRHGSEAGVGV